MNARSKPSTTNVDDLFDADELVALARVDIERGDLAVGLARLKQAIARDPSPSPALGLAGRLYAQLGLWEHAKTMFTQFLKQNPGAVHETFQLGMTHFDAGQGADAAKIWDGLLAEHPTHPPALFFRALVHTQSDEATKARPLLDTLLQTAPADNLYFERAKELLRSLAPGETDKKSGGATRIAPKDAYRTEH